MRDRGVDILLRTPRHLLSLSEMHVRKRGDLIRTPFSTAASNHRKYTDLEIPLRIECEFATATDLESGSERAGEAVGQGNGNGARREEEDA